MTLLECIAGGRAEPMRFERSKSTVLGGSFGAKLEYTCARIVVSRSDSFRAIVIEAWILRQWKIFAVIVVESVRQP